MSDHHLGQVVIRPWGQYEILYEDDTCKVKKIIVDPNSRLSYQYHNHRRECWTVTSGELTIILDDEKCFRSPGESIKIPLGAKHRAPDGKIYGGGFLDPERQFGLIEKQA